MKRWLLLAAMAAPPVAAQTNAELVNSEHYTRRRPYDLVHQRIEVGGFDWDSSAFDGSVTTTAVASHSRLARITLDMGRLLVDLQQEPGMDMAEYLRAQAAVFRLIDPAGLGRFRVVGLAKDAPLDPLPAGFTPDDLPEALRL